jgi:hypothetical protein
MDNTDASTVPSNPRTPPQPPVNADKKGENSPTQKPDDSVLQLGRDSAPSAILFAALIGAGLGTQINIDIKGYETVPIGPIAAGLSFGGGITYLLVTQPELEASKSVKLVLGTPLLKLRDAVFAIIAKGVENAQNAVREKVDSIVGEIKAVPQNIQNAITQSIESTIDDIKSIPSNAATTIADSVENAKASTVQKIDATVEGIKATPGRLADELTESAKNTQTNVVEGLSQLPTKAGELVQEAIDKMKEK